MEYFLKIVITKGSWKESCVRRGIFLLKLGDDETFRTGRTGKWRNYKLPNKRIELSGSIGGWNQEWF